MATHDQAIAQKQSHAAALNVPAKIWRHVNVPNAAAAISFINAPPPQGAGEASFTNGPNGSVDVYYYM
ncbi:MAG TPA: hypothetical protein VGD01_00025 [Candidatus Elarobacter sp.]|jgi:hypothetical protein